jgi:hypothetical protein
MTNSFSPNAARLLKVSFYGSILAFFLESVASLFVHVQLPTAVLAILYPSFGTLQGYCIAHACLYDSSAVATLYVVQLMTLIAFALLLTPVALSKRPPLEGKVAAMLGLVVVGALVDYVAGNFSFAPNWLLPNSVTESPLGLFRYAVWFSLAAFCIVVLVFGRPGEERPSASSPS